MQSKNATAARKNATTATAEAADREQARGLAAIQLERVRTQMMDVYRPLSAAYCAVDRTRAFMARELGFEWARMSAQDTCFMRPSEQLYPHLEVFTLDYASEFYAHARESQGATAWLKHSPSDIEVRIVAKQTIDTLITLYGPRPRCHRILPVDCLSCWRTTRASARCTPTPTPAA